jgi:predicted acylesterase/phospholipase RssA
MSRIGLALSGGGFRATLYHLGVVRFLRDANILTRVSHITSVSGGSIMAAHLVLNWQRYTGSEQDYDEAASELLNFIRLDVRNRVLRRYPLAAAANSLRWFVQKGRSRRLTRAGLLESLYENFLYGDRCLYELPANPQLHILATNVNEGCLCSFTRSGILDERRMPNGGTRFESVPSALATISMAVTASSAFPGFFPPLQLTAHDVGADEGRFPPHLFTDGGVYDNLGVRMFRHIQKSWIGHAAPLRPDDFVNLKAAADALQAALVLDAETPLRRLAQLVKLRTVGDSTALVGIPADSLPQSLWTVIELDRLYSEPAFDALEPDDEYAANLHHLAKGGRKLDSADHHWLNRYLANAAFADAIHQDLIQSTQTEFDAVIVSDAGKSFTISRRTKGGGLVGTAMRASDILMDRVWQLENDFFGGEADFIFAPMSLRVLRAEDPTAILPEIQQQVIGTRTDLDRFSELEISSLAQHGYAVMRKVCRSRQDVFGDELPAGPPWDPTGTEAPMPTSSTKAPSLITQQARELQSSSQRSLFRHLLSWRDWPTYVYLPLALLLFVGLPILAYRAIQILSSFYSLQARRRSLATGNRWCPRKLISLRRSILAVFDSSLILES